jgi:hypothetical protein
MLLDIDKVTKATQAQEQRCAAFGAMTAEKIRAASNCQFAVLPHQELARLASGWYAASAQAMLSTNYEPISAWAQAQARLAAGQNFAFEDVLELLRICRGAAIQDEKWNEDVFSVVDDVINETLQSIGSAVPWIIPKSLNYVSGNALRPETAAVQPPEQTSESWSGNWSDDRRDFGRNCLKFPIRVRAAAKLPVDELAYTENVSRSGLCFRTRSSSYKLQMDLMVTYPYWTDPGAINREYRAKVVRMDPMTDGSFGVAVEFTESLGPRPQDS